MYDRLSSLPHTCKSIIRTNLLYSFNISTFSLYQIIQKTGTYKVKKNGIKELLEKYISSMCYTCAFRLFLYLFVYVFITEHIVAYISKLFVWVGGRLACRKKDDFFLFNTHLLFTYSYTQLHARELQTCETDGMVMMIKSTPLMLKCVWSALYAQV